MDRNVPSERVVKAHTPLPPEQLKFRAMHGARAFRSCTSWRSNWSRNPIRWT